MNNWSCGWRKLVKWDDKNKEYLYKGNKIFPLSYKERRDMPTHLQNEYYWGEIERFDKIAEVESCGLNGEGKEFDFDEIWNILGWNK